MTRSLPLILLLAGCAMAPDNAPSLMPRPIEERSDAEPVRPVPVATSDAALDARIVGTGAAFDRAVAAFDKALGVARPRIARGARAARGSEGWLDAQTAVSELGQAYAELDAGMADLEALAIARASGNAPPYPALDARIAAAQATIDRSTATLNELKAKAGN